MGFIRTYGYLIRHESDFRIAKASHLLPDDTTYANFQKFIDPFRRIPDAATSPRYHYGQLRLTRLNWAVRIFRPRSVKHRFSWYYQNLYMQTGQYLERFVAPVLFLFASLTLILSSMQVGLAAQPQGPWMAFSQTSWGFSIAVIISIVLLSLSVCMGVIWHFARQMFYRHFLQTRSTTKTKLSLA